MRSGRPPSEDPKNKTIKTRMTGEDVGKLESRCKQCRAFITSVGSKEAHEVSKKFNSEEAMAIIQEKKRAVIDKTILLDAETRRGAIEGDVRYNKTGSVPGRWRGRKSYGK